MLVIPQAGGTVKRFPTSALKEAFLTNVDRLRGENLDPHPLSVAIQNAANREEWHNSFFDIVKVGKDLKDLSEP